MTVLALFVVALVFPGGASVAAEPAAPVITSHVDGERVSGQIEVTVESAAPYVLIALPHAIDSPWVPWLSDPETAQTVDGVATVSLNTSGYNGPTAIVARECQNSCSLRSPESAFQSETSVQVDVSNPAPQWNEQRWYSDFYTRDAMWVVDENAWAWYGFFIDGEYLPAVSRDPYVEIDPAKLGDGVHTVQMAHCTEISRWSLEPVCDMANAAEIRTFTIKTTLQPIINRVAPRTISPDGNGIADAASVTMTTDTPSEHVYWSLLRGSETVARGNFAAPGPGRHTFTVDGLDTQDQPLASGSYKLHIYAVILPWSSAWPIVDGETSTALHLDLDAPEVTSASAAPRVFHPPVDGYRDKVRITGSLSERASRFRVRILRAGNVVRRLWLGPQSAGGFATTWDGRGPKGGLLRPGRYRYDFFTRDRAGNKAIRRGGKVELRWRR